MGLISALNLTRDYNQSLNFTKVKHQQFPLGDAFWLFIVLVDKWAVSNTENFLWIKHNNCTFKQPIITNAPNAIIIVIVTNSNITTIITNNIFIWLGCGNK